MAGDGRVAVRARSGAKQALRGGEASPGALGASPEHDRGTLERAHAERRRRGCRGGAVRRARARRCLGFVSRRGPRGAESARLARVSGRAGRRRDLSRYGHTRDTCCERGRLAAPYERRRGSHPRVEGRCVLRRCPSGRWAQAHRGARHVVEYTVCAEPGGQGFHREHGWSGCPRARPSARRPRRSREASCRPRCRGSRACSLRLATCPGAKAS